MPMQDRPATRDDWNAFPLRSTIPLDYHASFTPEEYDILRLGLIPFEMEDKWFIFWEADSLFFHRSWTGIAIFRVDFRSTGTRFEVAAAFVTADQERYRRGADTYEAALLDFLIHGLLLGESVDFPLPSGRVASPRGLFQHHIAGTAFPERTLTDNQSTYLSRFKRWLRL